MANEIPWGWYIARSSALISFFLLYISIFLGLAVRTPLLNRIIKPIYSLRVHCWISLQALIFAFIHGIALLFDKMVSLKLGNIFIPFYPMSPEQSSAVDINLLALGVFSLYIMVVLVSTSYLKKYIAYSFWRGIHFLNVGLYFIAVIHSLYLGTDLKSGILREVFIYANGFLVLIFVINLFWRLMGAISDNPSKENEM